MTHTIEDSEWKRVQGIVKRKDDEIAELKHKVEYISLSYEDLEDAVETCEAQNVELFSEIYDVKKQNCDLHKELKIEKSTNSALLEKLNELLNTMETFGLANRKSTITAEDL